MLFDLSSGLLKDQINCKRSKLHKAYNHRLQLVWCTYNAAYWQPKRPENKSTETNFDPCQSCNPDRDVVRGVVQSQRVKSSVLGSRWLRYIDMRGCHYLR